MEKISIKKPRLRWLFGGVGFHNNEATMYKIMNEKFKNEGVLKTFNEISPTFSRVFAGYADWTKSAMDSFAEYYDLTFRKSGTVLYLVPGRMPFPDDYFDIYEYCEKVAKNLSYLINEKKLTKIRYYCVTNELSCGNSCAYLSRNLDLFKKLHTELYYAFKRHNVDVGLLATDCSELSNLHQIRWASENMDEITDAYCAHTYVRGYTTEDSDMHDFYYEVYESLVKIALRREKRFILGEYGIKAPDKQNEVMSNDVYYGVDIPESENMAPLSVAEVSIAAINAGCLATVYWSMFDYPDPFLKEDGDTEEEKARFDAARFSGHGISIRYNKNGLLKWCDDENDYSSRAMLYVMGYFAKLFKKNSRVLKIEKSDSLIRCAAVTNSDGSVSVIIVNRHQNDAEIYFDIEHNVDKPFRKYVYEADNVPYNEFNDLQKFSELVAVQNGEFNVKLRKNSVVFLTTDYKDRKPSEISGIEFDGGVLKWSGCKDAEHCYYRVYKDGRQIASTVATEYKTDGNGKYAVYSVDKYGNCLA